MIEIEASKLKDKSSAFSLGSSAAAAGIDVDALPEHCKASRHFMFGYTTEMEETHRRVIIGAILTHHPQTFRVKTDAIQEVLELLDWDVLQALSAAVSDPNKKPLEDSELDELFDEDGEQSEDLRDQSDIEEDRKRDREEGEDA